MSVNDNEKCDSITKQMDILRERKAFILSKKAEYDEQTVRRLISKITVFKDKLIFEFKSDMTINLIK
jgi:hypothetical protein